MVWLVSLSSQEVILVLHVSCWGSKVQSDQSRVTQNLRVWGLERPVQGNSSSLTMWWHSLLCSLSLLYRFLYFPLVVYLLVYLLWVVTYWLDVIYCWQLTFIDECHLFIGGVFIVGVGYWWFTFIDGSCLSISYCDFDILTHGLEMCILSVIVFLWFWYLTCTWYLDDEFGMWGCYWLSGFSTLVIFFYQ